MNKQVRKFVPAKTVLSAEELKCTQGGFGDQGPLLPTGSGSGGSSGGGRGGGGGGGW
jgi:hypothetical protein